MCPVSVAHYDFSCQWLGEARIQFFPRIGLHFCLALLMRLVQNYFMGSTCECMDWASGHIETNLIFPSYSFRTSLMFFQNISMAGGMQALLVVSPRFCPGQWHSKCDSLCTRKMSMSWEFNLALTSTSPSNSTGHPVA